MAADIMSSPVTTIPAEMSIAEAVRHFFSQRVETTFPVVDGDRVCGLLSIPAVRRISATEIWQTTAGQAAAIADLVEPALARSIRRGRRSGVESESPARLGRDRGDETWQGDQSP